MANTACFRYPAALVWGLALLSCACGAQTGVSSDARAAAAELRALTEAPTRVVWVQDVDQGTDFLAYDDKFRLMGFDTEDPRGERPILPEVANYARPLLSPRGTRVIFSRRTDHKMYVVNWDGTGLKALGAGFAVDTWLNPADGTEWVYYAADPQDVPRQDQRAYSAIRRCPLDNPSASELVWNATEITQLDENNFQISADGARASLVGPELLGVADLPNAGWTRYGKGCWPALAPDNSYRFWHFDGGHRSLTLYDAGATNARRVVINDAPGVNGAEVFHPRWANHPRYLAMDGPLKIAGGGPGVELYVGRFNAAFTAVEQWVRVTHNDRADFLPDVWVASGLDPRFRAARAAAAAPAAERTAWPGRRDGLIFLWENRSANNEVTGGTGTVARVCRVEPRGRARFGRFLEMDIVDGAFVAQAGAAELAEACRRSGELSVEAVLQPREPAASNAATVMACASDEDNWAFRLAAEQGRLVFLLCTSDGPVEALRLGELKAKQPQHIIVTYRPGEAVGYVNGEAVLTNRTLRGNLSQWSPHPLVFGAEPDGRGSWSGRLEGVALYSRSLGADEARAEYRLYAPRLAGRAPAPRLVLDAQLLEAAAVPEPAAISPYRRGLVVDRYAVQQVREGTCTNREVLVAHWAIMDGKKLDGAEREKGRVYRMNLEAFDGRPELEGERLIMDTEEFLLPLYYDVDS